MPIESMVAEILESKKYAGLDRALVERVCAKYVPRYIKRGDAVKAIKKELHIIYGSFLTKDCHARAESLIRNYSGEDIHADKDFAVRLMELHVSTSERISCVSEINAMICDYIRPDDVFIDIGCGFNPFTLPFYPTKPGAYIAYDICARTTDLINYYFKPLGPAFRAAPLDAVSQGPSIKAGVALIYKLFPLLEQQCKGRAFELLRAMDYRVAIVSFPTKSVSGREKGMEAFYADMFESGLPDNLTISDKAVYGEELFYIITC